MPEELPEEFQDFFQRITESTRMKIAEKDSEGVAAEIYKEITAGIFIDISEGVLKVAPREFLLAFILKILQDFSHEFFRRFL